MRLAWSKLGATRAIVSATPLRGSATSVSPTWLKKPINTKSMMSQKAIRATTDRTVAGAPGFVSPRASAVRASRLVRPRARLTSPAAILAITYPTTRMPRANSKEGRVVEIRCTDGPTISMPVMWHLPWCGRWSTSHACFAVSRFANQELECTAHGRSPSLRFQGAPPTISAPSVLLATCPAAAPRFGASPTRPPESGRSPEASTRSGRIRAQAFRQLRARTWVGISRGQSTSPRMLRPREPSQCAAGRRPGAYRAGRAMSSFRIRFRRVLGFRPRRSAACPRPSIVHRHRSSTWTM